MKNILFGLMAVTSVAFATQPNLGADVSQNPAGTVFAGGQTGEIAVHGNLQANPDTVKYVVYASLNGDYDATSGEVWKLPTFTTEAFTYGTTPSNPDELGFGGQPIPKLYVKKVNGDNNGTIDLTTETVSYKLLVDPAFGFTKADIVKDFSSTFEKTLFTIWSLMSKATMEDIINKAGVANNVEVVRSSSESSTSFSLYLQKKGTDSWYKGGKFLYIERESLGVLKIYEHPNFYGIDPGFELAWGQAIDKVLATTQAGYSELAMLVKVQ